jgi:hypothetical protein
MKLLSLISLVLGAASVVACPLRLPASNDTVKASQRTVDPQRR